MPRRRQFQESHAIDRAVSRTFWEHQSQAAADPRAVTLDRGPAAWVTRRVRVYQSWLRRHLARLHLSPARVLDLGCGNGDWTAWYASFATTLLAVDFSEGFVAHVQRRLANLGISVDIQVRHADLTTFEIPGYWDFISCGAVTQYLDDREVRGLFKRVRSALAPAGLFYLRTTIARRRPYTRQDSTYQGIYRSADWYLDEIASSGLRVEASATATRFVADELAYQLCGETAIARGLGSVLAAVRWAYRAPLRSDVLAVIARPANPR